MTEAVERDRDKDRERSRERERECGQYEARSWVSRGCQEINYLKHLLLFQAHNRELNQK